MDHRSLSPFQEARFLLSAPTCAGLSPDHGAEVAFVGRSNSGKSSAINKITGRKGLAKCSKTPGKTRTIVQFALSSQQRLVDLPGYGYAGVSHTLLEEWQHALCTYLLKRACLKGLVLSMDSRHPLKRLDLDFLSWLEQRRPLPVTLLLTKADKLTAQAQQQVKATVQAAFPSAEASLFSTRGLGVTEIRERLSRWLAPEAADEAEARRGRI